MTITAEREELHRLVDALPDSEVPGVRRYLRYLQSVAEDPVLRAFLDAPEDDEPLTEEQEAKLLEAEGEIARGEVESWSKVKRDLADLP